MPETLDSSMSHCSKPYYPNPDNVVFPNSIPYRGAIPGGLHSGKMIEIKGSVPYGADMFAVNLLTGLDQYCDRPLHLSVRFHGRTVVRNSLERGEWGPEERHGIFPFSSGKDFTIMILAEMGCYRIAVNNQHCWEFNHRMPMARVNSILIEGSVHIERIEFIDQGSPYRRDVYYPSITTDPSYPSICPGITPTVPVCPGIPTVPTVYPVGPSYPTVCPPITGRISPGYFPTTSIPTVCPPPTGRISPGYVFPTVTVCPPGPGMQPSEQICPQPGYIPTGGSNLAPVFNPSIPYAYPIYGGLKPGMMAYISGRPSASAYRFTLNFQQGTAPYPPPDIAFHLDVRFPTRAIVRNSRTNNVWEREETVISHFPFQPGVNFDLIVRVESDRYMIALNGQHFLEFRHRLHPASRFDTLYVENDIVVSSIRFA